MSNYATPQGADMAGLTLDKQSISAPPPQRRLDVCRRGVSSKPQDGRSGTHHAATAGGRRSLLSARLRKFCYSRFQRQPNTRILHLPPAGYRLLFQSTLCFPEEFMVITRHF